MRMYDIIDNKKHGKELSFDEIKFFVDGFTDGSVPDYQASAAPRNFSAKALTALRLFLRRFAINLEWTKKPLSRSRPASAAE